jgi:hypothetical protein
MNMGQIREFKQRVNDFQRKPGMQKLLVKRNTGRADACPNTGRHTTGISMSSWEEGMALMAVNGHTAQTSLVSLIGP